MKTILSSGLILAAVALLSPILAVYAPLGFAPLVGLAATLGLVAHLAGRFRGGRVAIAPDRGSLWLFSALAILAAVSAAWSIDPQTTFDKYPPLVLTLACAGALIGLARGLDRDARRALERAIVMGTIIGVGALAVERATGGLLVPIHLTGGYVNHFMNQFNRGVTVLAILIWPAVCVAARRKPAYGIVLGIALFAALLTFRSDAAIMGMVSGAAAFGLVWTLPKLGGRILAAVAVASIVLCPFAIRTLPPAKESFETMSLPRSTYHRLLIWKFTTDRIFERPVLGWGYNSSRIIPGGKDRLDSSEAALPLHPHNGALQLWLELGVGGALLGAAVALNAARAIIEKSADRLSRATAAATFASAFPVLLVSYGIWQGWWMCTLIVAAALAIGTTSRAPDGNRV